MSDSSYFENSLSFILTEIDEQSELKCEISHCSTSLEISNLTVHSLTENSTNVVSSDKIDDDTKNVKKIVQPQYPLTEWSKRKMAAKIRMEREKKIEQIKKIKERMVHGDEVIKYHSRKNNLIKFESLQRVKNNQWNRDNSYISNDSKGPSLNDKIKALEKNLRQLENELIMEKNKLGIAEEHTIADNQNFIEVDQNPDISNVDSREEIIEEDLTNSMKCLYESRSTDNCSSMEYVYENVSNLETRLTFSPKHIEFKFMKMNINKTDGILKQQINVSNYSKNTIICSYSHLFDPNFVLNDNMNIIKVNVATRCRLQPGLSANYVVTFNPKELPDSRSYASLKGVKLVFETTSNNNQLDEKYVFHIPVEFCIVKPEPELVTKTIIFPAVLENYSKKYLILKNNGDSECRFSVLKETDDEQTYSLVISRNSTSLNSLTGTEKSDVTLAEEIVDSIIENMFNYFTWKNHINVLLPARGSVKVPVIFNQNLASSSISECYIIVFDNTEYIIPNQKVNVIGHIENQNVLITPNVIDLGLCYLMSSVQVASFHLQNNSRVVIPFEIKLPAQLSKHVELSPSRGYIKAGSSFEIFIRLYLKYEILRPDDCRMYFNAETGILDFPVAVYTSNSKRPSQVHVSAVVTTPFGLKLTPNTLDFGTVNTSEVVVRTIMMANHSRTTMVYGFLKLPERVSVYPTAFGTILSGEEISFNVHYSPSAKDLPKNVYSFVDDFILTCSTKTGLNAKKLDSEIMADEQSSEIMNKEEMSTSKINQTSKIMNQINELDHGPDKIQILRIENAVKVEALDLNAILQEATIRCLATVRDVPVELSVQKIIFQKTHFTSYSTFKIELRGSNLASRMDRNIRSYPDFKFRFEFVSNDLSVEFKPKNGILRSKEILQIFVIYRPMFDDELQNMYDKCLTMETENEPILEDENSFINQVYKKKPTFKEQTKVFKANKMFYSSIMCRTKIVSAVCFIQFINQKSIEYFGFDTESLKLSLVCPATKPNIILFSDKINFGKRTMDIRHDDWLLVRNVTTNPVPLKISLPKPNGPFFCAFALLGEQLLLPGRTTAINISFIPENEMMVNETLDVTSDAMRLTVELSGSGIGPSCKVTPDDTYNTIQITREHHNNKFTFRVLNTSGAAVRFNVQMEWTGVRSKPMTDDQAYEFAESLRTAAAAARDDQEPPRWLRLDGPDWTELKDDVDVFDLGNGGRPLRFRLNPNEMRYVQVTFSPFPARPADPVLQAGSDDDDSPPEETGPARDDDEDDDGSVDLFWCRVYAAKFNVHVGHSVLRRFYLFAFVDEMTA